MNCFELFNIQEMHNTKGIKISVAIPTTKGFTLSTKNINTYIKDKHRNIN